MVPAAMVLAAGAVVVDAEYVRQIFLTVFFILGALANGLTIAVIGFLMEISPDDKRPAYSGYFNAITAPTFLLPLLAGGLATVFGLSLLFVISLFAAVLQALILWRISRVYSC